MTPALSRPRQVWLDWLRLLALLMVMVSHCCDPFTFNPDPAVSSNPLVGFWGALYQSMTRFCVPLFVVITGSLLLPVKMPMETFYRKRILRVLWPFLIWGVLYNLFPVVAMACGAEASTVTSCFVSVTEPTGDWAPALALIARIPIDFSLYAVHLWYVYLVIGLYLYLPIFSAWVEKATLRQKKLVLALWAITLFIPYIQPFTEQLWGSCAWNPFGMLYYFAGFSGYLLLGHVIASLPTPSWRTTLSWALPLLVLGYAITFLGFRTTQAELWAVTRNPWEMAALATDPATVAHPYQAIQETFLLYCSPNVAMMTLGILLLFKHFNHVPAWLGSLLANLTACGFGIYLVHYLYVGLANHLVSALPLQLIIPASAILVFAFTWVTVALLRRLVPGKWLLG